MFTYKFNFMPNDMLQINSCNGMRCGETFKGPNSPNKPSLWTENWTSLYVYIKCTFSTECNVINMIKDG